MQKKTKIELEISRPFHSALSQKSRYKIWYGGRGSAKSWCVARLLLRRAMMEKTRILCARELQNSIADSVHRLLKDQIGILNLHSYFDVQNAIIKSFNGSEFLFKGVRHNILEIKSLEGVDLCWVEEAQRVSEESWNILIPTIRKESSEIWLTFNPYLESDPTYQRFIVNPPPDTLIRRVNWDDNPWFPDTLRAEMEYCRRVDPDAYRNIWLGEPLKLSAAAVFQGKFTVDCFETPDDARFFFGADWGFSQDPTVLIRCWIRDRTLFVDWEAWGVGVEIDETPKLFDSVPGSRRWKICADSARPETISAVRRAGFPIVAAEKWPGSVEDGVAYLRQFERIIVHERCPRLLEELARYSYKQDRVTGEPLPILVDAWNHCIDALRYALSEYIRRGWDHTAQSAHAPAGNDRAGLGAWQTSREPHQPVRVDGGGWGSVSGGNDFRGW